MIEFGILKFVLTSCLHPNPYSNISSKNITFLFLIIYFFNNVNKSFLLNFPELPQRIKAVYLL